MVMTAFELWNLLEQDEEERRKSGIEAHPMYHSEMQTKALIVIAARLEEIAARLAARDEES